MFPKIILFFSLILSVSFAQSGWTPSHEAAVSELNEKETRAFRESLKSCQLARDRKMSNFEFTPHEANVFLGTMGDVNYAADKIIRSGWKEGTRVFQHTRGTGMYLYELLNSNGFMLAMKKCFNGNESKENLYVAELLFIDAAVKGVYLGGTYLSAKYLLARQWGLALLTTLVVAPISGSTPKPRDISYIEHMENNLKLISEQINLIKQPKMP